MARINEIREADSSQPSPTAKNSMLRSGDLDDTSEHLHVDSKEENQIELELGSSQLTTKDAQKGPELSEHQKSINFVLQFIDQVSQMDDKIMIKLLMRSDSLSTFIYLT